MKGAVKRLERIAMEHALGVGSVEDIDSCLAAHPEEPELLSILRGPRRDKVGRFVEFAAQRRAFQPVSAPGGSLALEILRDQAASVLSGSVTAGDLGALVHRVDAMFLDSTHYPPPVHDLWHAFDWCDETWTLDNQPGLRAILEEFSCGAEQ
jgi:hypothetical protein